MVDDAVKPYSDGDLAELREQQSDRQSARGCSMEDLDRLLATIAARDARISELEDELITRKLAKQLANDRIREQAEEITELKARVAAFQKCRHCGYGGNSTMCNACGRAY